MGNPMMRYIYIYKHDAIIYRSFKESTHSKKIYGLLVETTGPYFRCYTDEYI
jgi:hypothetical protein